MTQRRRNGPPVGSSPFLPALLVVTAAVTAGVTAGVGVTGCTPAGTDGASDDGRAPTAAGSEEVEWLHYGGDAGGARFSDLDQVDPDNVARLAVAWTIRTGDASHEEGTDEATHEAVEEPVTEGCARCHRGDFKFETTPLMADGRLLLSTPLQRVLSLDPETGQEQWRFDPEIEMDVSRSEGFISRGVSYWRSTDASEASETCGSRVIAATIDARMFALDAASGSPCLDFGANGVVRLDQGVGEVQVGQYGVTSPPVIVGDVIVVGSSMGDNRRVDMERGTVRAFDARTGALLWGFDPVPRSPDHPGWDTWEPDAARRTGGANAWPPLSADPELGLVYVPTGSAAPDFYGGERRGANLFANSIVALDAATGDVRWHFQTVHHDLWDYDIPSQPVLATIRMSGQNVPAVIVTTKTGFVFVFDRRDGTPLFEIEERQVPESTVPGESAWPTQPFPTIPAPTHPLGMSEDDVWGLNDEEREACRQVFSTLDNRGVFTPPSLQGTLFFPGYAGGFQWGGPSVDEARDVMVVNQLRLPFWVRLAERTAADRGNQRGTPYTMSRAMLASPSGLPCSRPPWGVLMAIRLSTGETLWEQPFGTMPGLEEVPGSDQWGSLNIGGALLTASGLTIIAATADRKIRAFATETGELLWEDTLPSGGMATPMTYAVGGKQYIVIAAGGHSAAGMDPADYIVAYALPQ